MQRIGTVKIVQIQRTPLKVGERLNRRYDPAGITAVEAVRLTPQGIVGVMPDGTTLLDTHHTEHPKSRHRGGNGISLGFTAHYDRIRGRFGPHAVDGVAGENIIIKADDAYTFEQIGGKLIIGDYAINVLRPIPPCQEFSRYVTQDSALDGKTLKAVLQFLSEGRRGFYAEPVSLGDICTGDPVYKAE